MSSGSISISSLIINEVYSAPSLSGRLATLVTIYPISVILYLVVVVLVKVLFVVIKELGCCTVLTLEIWSVKLYSKLWSARDCDRDVDEGMEVSSISQNY